MKLDRSDDVDAPKRPSLRLISATASDLARLDRFPDFLILGPQRTGTTWLHAQIRFHPQLFLTEPKELYYFNSLKGPEPPRFEGNSLGAYLDHFRDSPRWYVAKMLSALVRFGEPYRPIMRGEATASYAALDEEVIGELVSLNPMLKVVLMIRDPIQRAWSHAKKDLARRHRRSINEVPEHDVLEFFASDYQLRCAQSVAQFDRWSANLPRGHVFVGRFEQIERDPVGLLVSLLAFLGVRHDAKYVSTTAREAVNRTESQAIPERYFRFLSELLSREREATRRRFVPDW